ncbi:MarR family winged helix-turn-helix transcriptional regulator [Microlunatus panaciterrae]|uniref:DNA-binding MarR family transcriptional regulator n=1 Tax=Microlunatus panaciterrae TaxID=400768 RepID=A0ABS2RMU7_9ACTN|nr:MarR family winged helix-turn-helix transcriptional regulator [Microlunatus panaciterrae]MBM7799998.1 DNA-binding MarR family transcriptional regulator [Microlunatus panaciterrae]
MHENPLAEVVETLQQATRDFLSVATHSVDAASEISLPQMRLLLAISETTGSSCAELGRELGIAGSSVTRLADRLSGSGHLVRESSPTNRSVVVLRLTELGQRAVSEVLSWREHVFSEVAARMAPESTAHVVRGLTAFHQALNTQSLSTQSLNTEASR